MMLGHLVRMCGPLCADAWDRFSQAVDTNARLRLVADALDSTPNVGGDPELTLNASTAVSQVQVEIRHWLAAINLPCVAYPNDRI